MTTSSMSTIKTRSSEQQLKMIEVKPGVQFSLAVLQDLLPNVETVLFFGKVYDLDATQLGNLLHQVLNTDLTSALFGEGGMHSTELQAYLIGWTDEFGYWHEGIIDPVRDGDVTFDPDVPTGEILPEVWKQLEVQVAKSIKDVAAKLELVVGLLPGKQGSMVFGAMMKMNAKRPTIGDFKASIKHDPVKENLLVLDVSGSMSESTIRLIIEDVVALSYVANAHMAVVSNTTTYWAPGTYSVDDVLEAAEYGGTHYETLKDLFDRDWGVVITIADYDSSLSAKQRLVRCKGHIDVVLDISLVSQPTFLAECVGQLADEVQPVLLGSGVHMPVE